MRYLFIDFNIGKSAMTDTMLEAIVSQLQEMGKDDGHGGVEYNAVCVFGAALYVSKFDYSDTPSLAVLSQARRGVPIGDGATRA